MGKAGRYIGEYNARIKDLVLDGWHGSATRIKILPSDFQPDDVGRPVICYR